PKWSASQETAPRCVTDADPAPFRQHYAEQSSGGMATGVPSPDAGPGTASRSTTSPPGAKDAPPTPTPWSPSAGTTTTSQSTNTDSPPPKTPTPNNGPSPDETDPHPGRDGNAPASSVPVQRFVETAPGAFPGQGLHRSGGRVATEQHPGDPRDLPRLRRLPVRQRDHGAGRHVETGFHHAVVSQGDPDTRVGAEQTALADADPLLAAT